jgi:hypothetical protein
MALKFFIVPAFDPTAAEVEINAFIGRHRVVTIERRLVDQGSGSFWAICVDHFPAGAGPADGLRRGSLDRNRIDYKQLLSPEEFAVFSRLRDLRKEIAQAEAVQQRCRSTADLKAIDGFGESRIEKYGDRLLGILTNLPETPIAEAGDATGRQPV